MKEFLLTKNTFRLFTLLKYIIALLLLNGIFGYNALAQEEAIIEGVVKDDITGETLIGASVIVEGTNIGTTTDFDGKFKIMMPITTKVLVVRYLGYQSKEITISTGSQISISLKPNVTQMDEVVVIGYDTQKKESVVGAIVQTAGEELLKTRGSVSLTNSLVGLVSGLSAIQTTGQPGESAADIFIRGKASWVDNSPLFLVDGIERDYEDIDPNEIESISVLKDASATAVFGAKGANGVILITTKQGEEGKPKFSFSTNFSFKQPVSNFYMADRVSVMEMKNQALKNDGVFDPNAYYSEQDINNWRNNVNPDLYPEVDWYDELVKDYGITSNYNLNVSGGSQRINYFVSLGYANDGDIFKTEPNPYYDPSFNYERYNYRTNFNVKVTKTTKIKIGLAGSLSFKNQAGYGSSSDDDWAKSDFFKLIYYKAPTYVFPIRYSDGNIGHDGGGSNPYLLLNYSGAHRNRKNVQASDIQLKQELDFVTKGLSLTGKLSYNTAFDYKQNISNKTGRNTGFNVPSYLYTPTDTLRFPSDNFVEGPVTIGNESLGAYKRNLYYEAAIRYNRQFNKHTVTAMGLFMRSQNISRVNWPSFEESWIGRVTYDYNQRYFIEMNGAYNGSEKFAPGLRFGFFPSFAGGWIVSNEKFFRDSRLYDVVDRFKIRGSYGEVGYDKGVNRWTYLQTYESGGNIYFGNPPSKYYTNKEGRAANPNATWERAVKANIGFELELLSHFSLVVDLFNEHRSSILMERKTIHPWFGLENPYENIGETKSQGFEATLGWSKNISKDFNINARAIASYAENRVVFRDDPKKTPDYLKDAGKPIGSDYTLKTDGIYQDWDDVYNSPGSVWGQESRIPGDLKYVDYNGDGVINDLDKVVAAYQDYPMFTYSFQLGFTWKGLQFSSLFTGVNGVQKSVPDALLFEFTSADYEQANPHNEQAWTPSNRNTDVPILRSNNTTRLHNQQYSDYQFQNANYFRLKRVELSYMIKSKSLKRNTGIGSVTIYVGGNNLFTFTEMDPRFDPEAATLSSYPLIRSYNTGLTIKF
ncbi:SusC/RagA family TonB-linked outer membrane protein [Flammeovirga aprica]|uniref:TonB-dependent receptor n=1 Tax=Flammeovirga aprica JL-4 TaxID=694437 RepID=A0A7X9XBW5_9BACT|nr:TonB-dependent receptor [Flammeovirga aprica]NME71024.1 TonB-dependent receptor [Flammeovirga aprica JL-4]